MIEQASGAPRGGRKSGPKAAFARAFEHALVRYAFAVVTVAAAFGLRKLLEPVTGTGAPFVLFFAAVAVTSPLGRARAGYLRHAAEPPDRGLHLRRACRLSDVARGLSGGAVRRRRSDRRLLLVRRDHGAANGRGDGGAAPPRQRGRRDRELGSRGGEQKRLRWSPNTGVFSGLPDGEPANLARWLGLVHPDDRDAFQRAYERSLDPAGDGTMRCETGSCSADGVVRWFSWEGRTYYQERADGRAPARQVGTAIDITERRQREEALRQLSAEVSRSEGRRREPHRARARRVLSR